MGFITLFFREKTSRKKSQNNYPTVSGIYKIEISEMILKNLFDIDKKELSGVLKTLSKYEEAKTDVDRAILYPSTTLADKIIKKIVKDYQKKSI